MTPAKEAAARANVKQALLKLTTGAAFTRNDLFGKGAASEVKRSYRILKLLAERELIRSAPTSGTRGEALLHEAIDAAKARHAR